MFIVFKFLPDIIWYMLLIVGVLSILLSNLLLLSKYETILKGSGILVTIFSIFLLGMLYADNTWKQAAKDLENKVAIAEVESKAATNEIRQKLITKTITIKEKQDAIIQYIDREVLRVDNSCKIPKEFIQAINMSAEEPK